MSLNKNQKRITVKLLPKLIASFDAQLEGLFISRDRFIDYVVSIEIDNLVADLPRVRLSKKGARAVRDALDAAGAIHVSIRLQSSTWAALDKALSERNIVRDAFFNRLIALLRCNSNLRKLLDVPLHRDMRYPNADIPIPISPIEAMEELQADPLYSLREVVRITCNGEGLWSIGFPPEMTCFNDDVSIPATAKHRKLLRDLLDPGTRRQTRGRTTRGRVS